MYAFYNLCWCKFWGYSMLKDNEHLLDLDANPIWECIWILSYETCGRFNYHSTLAIIVTHNNIIPHHNLSRLMCFCHEHYHLWGLNLLTVRLYKPSVRWIFVWIYQKWPATFSLLKPQLFALDYNLYPRHYLHWLMVLLPSAIIKCCLQHLPLYLLIMNLYRPSA